MVVCCGIAYHGKDDKHGFNATGYCDHVALLDLEQFCAEMSAKHGGEPAGITFYKSKVEGDEKVSLYSKSSPYLDKLPANAGMGGMYEGSNYFRKKYILFDKDKVHPQRTLRERNAVDLESKHHSSSIRVAELHNTLLVLELRGWAPTNNDVPYARETACVLACISQC
jgi:hypothetical protein